MNGKMNPSQKKKLSFFASALKLILLITVVSTAVFLIRDSGGLRNILSAKTTGEISYTLPGFTTQTDEEAKADLLSLSHVPTKAEMESLITEKLLTNTETRPFEKLESLDYIIIHYVANPGASAINHYTYFNKNFEYPSSCHYIVGLEGEIYRFIPDDEVAYHAGKNYNYRSIGIEVCHPDASGRFTDATYLSLLKLVSWLCHEYNLSSDQVIRHYDVTGKMCPVYYVNHEDEWALFKSRLLTE